MRASGQHSGPPTCRPATLSKPYRGVWREDLVCRLRRRSARLPSPSASAPSSSAANSRRRWLHPALDPLSAHPASPATRCITKSIDRNWADTSGIGASRIPNRRSDGSPPLSSRRGGCQEILRQTNSSSPRKAGTHVAHRHRPEPVLGPREQRGPVGRCDGTPRPARSARSNSVQWLFIAPRQLQARSVCRAAPWPL
jgi:hypothetical protein